MGEGKEGRKEKRGGERGRGREEKKGREGCPPF